MNQFIILLNFTTPFALMNSSLDIAGIYEIQNISTQESYIGSSKHVFRRLHDHLVQLTADNHINKLLQHSWNTHSPSVITFRILELVDDMSVLFQREIYWIKKKLAIENGFNTRSDQFKNRTLIPLSMERKIELENLQMGSMNETLQQLIKMYGKFNSK